MDFFTIECRCHNNHHQTLKVELSLGIEYARNLAGLLDGTSPMYLVPPGESSLLGKCGICGSSITATVIDHREGGV